MTHGVGHGQRKFPRAATLLSSQNLGWKNLAAEVRAHGAGEIPPICSDQMEVTMTLQDAAGAYVSRRGNGVVQRARARSRTLWLCPPGVDEDCIHISEVLPEVLHLYLPQTCLAEISSFSSRNIALSSMPYLSDMDDEFVRQICLRIYREMQQETAAGAVLVEHLSACLAAHLATLSGQAPQHVEALPPAGLDAMRLRRVTDYIEDNLLADLTVHELSGIACLSRFHFSRAFKLATGMPPHAYIAARRMSKAEDLLVHSELPIAEVALICRFSSQATFTRAFKQSEGVSPARFRLGRRRSASTGRTGR